MPVVIDEMTSRFDVRDEAKVRALVRKEVKAALREELQRNARSGGGVDPSDPSASGRPDGGG